MKRKINNPRSLLIIMLIVTAMIKVLFACQESSVLIYYDETAPAPPMIDKSSIMVENFPGKSVLIYKVPEHDNLLYVKAVYESAPGLIKHAQSSRFVDTLALEGFANGGNTEVKLYTVGKNKKESAPISITVSPLNPPIVDAFPSLNLIAAFGGVEGSYTNVHKTNIKVVLMGDTAHTGEPVFLQSFTTNNKDARFTLRGLPSEKCKFVVYMMDRWGNKSEAKEYELTPLFEERLDKTLWKEHKLPSDFPMAYENDYRGYRFVNLWNGVIAQPNTWANIFFPARAPMPKSFTIDLGVTVKLSRYNIVPSWMDYYPIREWEVYGTTSLNPGDEFEGGDWKLVGKFEVYKPSGDDFTIITKEDIDYVWPGGANYDVKPSELQPDPYFPLRMIRFRVLSTCYGGTNFQLDELTIWGEIEK